MFFYLFYSTLRKCLMIIFVIKLLFIFNTYLIILYFFLLQAFIIIIIINKSFDVLNKSRLYISFRSFHKSKII